MVIQLTLIIPKSNGLAELLQDVHITTYQICRTEEKKIEQKHFTNEYVT